MKSRLSIKNSFAYQASFCRKLHAPFSAKILDLCAEHYDTSVPFRKAIGDWAGNPVEEAFPLRFLGAWHALALAGLIDWHAKNTATLWATLEQAITNYPDHFVRYRASPPQTNEVGRSAALLLGFMNICTQTDKPLVLYEIGTSAGLNLRWDQYQYASNSAHVWGDKTATTQINTVYDGTPYIPAVPIRVAARYGCDIAPIDINDKASCDRLRSYVWADHETRRTTLENAIAVARNIPAHITKMHAGNWVEESLTVANNGLATVLFHSIMWMYLPEAEQNKIDALIKARGDRSTPDNPFFHLALEFTYGIDQPAQLILTSWPGGNSKVIATANPHCTQVSIV